MNRAELDIQQKKCIERVLAETPTLPRASLPNFLIHVGNSSKKELQYCFGHYGARFREFADSIDLDHADLNNLFNGQLVANHHGSFGGDAHDLLKIASYGTNCLFSPHVLVNLKRVITQNEHWGEISKKLDSPHKNLLHIRFIASESHRKSLRSLKRSQTIDSALLCKKGKELWESLPYDFSLYTRGEMKYAKEIEKAREKYTHFANFGLKCMADEVKKTIDFIENKSKLETYLGFNRVSLVQASIILAKMIGCEYRESPNETICIQEDRLYKFSYSSPPNNVYTYSPYVYCLHDQAVPSNEIRKVIDHVEHMPEFEGKAAFDHYKIVLPSFCYVDNRSFINAEGKIVYATSYGMMRKAIDLELLKSKRTVGALLGERDGQFYFICYWV